MLERDFVSTLHARLKERNPLIQVVLGPRQVGKTTGIQQLIKKIQRPILYASADDILAPNRDWLLHQWQEAHTKDKNCIVIIDEIQKITQWSETIKKLWDPKETKLPCVLLGSSSLALQQGLSESLTGRFELISVPHWNYWEMHKAFRISLSSYMKFGGYPGSLRFIDDYERWYLYIKNSIIDRVIGNDILELRTVQKPALFRQAFELLCHYPAQEVSYTKLLGQLQDKGNTDLMKHYIELYEGAFLCKALPKFSTNPLHRKTSSPKILPLCPAFYSVALGPDGLKNPEHKGRMLELMVGMDLARLPGELFYWREGTHEVDYIYRLGNIIYAIEVKSGKKRRTEGLLAFQSRFPKSHAVIITPENHLAFSKDPKTFLGTVTPPS